MSKIFTFPGFIVTDNADNDRFKVDIGTLAYGGRDYVLHMMIPHNAPDHGEFSVAKVEYDGRAVWSFDRTRDADTFTRLTSSVEDEPVIAFVSKKTGRVVKTHPFLCFTRKLPLSVAMQIAYKRQAAELLGVEADYTPAEESFRQVDPTEAKLAAEAEAKRQAEQVAREAEAKAARDAAEAKRQAREAKREETRKAIAGREPVKVKTEAGIRYGQPVLQTEIKDLEPKGLYVLVDSFDEAGVPHGPKKAFKAIAQKGKGIVMANASDAIDWHDDTLVMPESKGSKNFQIQGEVFEVLTYAGLTEVETLAKIGVDQVQFAAFPVGNNGQYRVFILDGTAGKTNVIDAGLLKPYTGESSKKKVKVA